MLDRLMISFASTRNRRNIENLSLEQEIDEFNLLDAYLSRQRAFNLFQLIMQFQTLLIDVV
jgi:hypothetical protein